jgi:hypothetical protein
LINDGRCLRFEWNSHAGHEASSVLHFAMVIGRIRGDLRHPANEFFSVSPDPAWWSQAQSG